MDLKAGFNRLKLEPRTGPIMRILMVIIVAMIVAGGTGWYVLQSVV